MIKEGVEMAEIRVPIALPTILKDYAKAVLRCQPDDIVAWSVKYFSEMATQPPDNVCQDTDLKNFIDDQIKDTLKDDYGKYIDLQGIRSIYSEFSDIGRIPVYTLRTAWISAGYSLSQLRELLILGRFYESAIDRDWFIAIVCAKIGVALKTTLRLFVEVVCGTLDTSSQGIPYWKFEKIYLFLMSLKEDSADDQNELLETFRTLSENQGRMVMRKDILEADIADWKLQIDWTGTYIWTTKDNEIKGD